MGVSSYWHNWYIIGIVFSMMTIGWLLGVLICCIYSFYAVGRNQSISRSRGPRSEISSEVWRRPNPFLGGQSTSTIPREHSQALELMEMPPQQ